MTSFEYIRGKYGSRKLGGRFVWLNYRYYLQTLDFDLMEDDSYTFDEIKADEELNDPNTLKEEYERDVAKGEEIQIPENYFPNDDPSQPPLVLWRAHANLLYCNWLNYFVYQTTPYDLNELDK